MVETVAEDDADPEEDWVVDIAEAEDKNVPEENGVIEASATEDDAACGAARTRISGATRVMHAEERCHFISTAKFVS